MTMWRAVGFYVALFLVSYAGLLVHSGFFSSVEPATRSAGASPDGKTPEPMLLPPAVATENGGQVAVKQSLSFAGPPAVNASPDYVAQSGVGMGAVDYSNPAKALRSLERAALRAADGQTRLAAVTSLVQLARDGDPEGKIQEALRISSTDMDPAVAAAARQGHAEVAARAEAANPAAFANTNQTPAPARSYPTAASVTGENPYRTQLALERASYQAPDAQTRMSAVTSLAEIARAGDPDGRIREALRMASTDTDPNVATAARQAQDEVAAWYPTL